MSCTDAVIFISLNFTSHPFTSLHFTAIFLMISTPNSIYCSYPPCLEIVSFIRYLRTRHAVVTRDTPNMDKRILENLFAFYTKLPGRFKYN
jgi:hypothetical protein